MNQNGMKNRISKYPIKKMKKKSAEKNKISTALSTFTTQNFNGTIHFQNTKFQRHYPHSQHKISTALSTFTTQNFNGTIHFHNTKFNGAIHIHNTKFQRHYLHSQHKISTALSTFTTQNFNCTIHIHNTKFQRHYPHSQHQIATAIFTFTTQNFNGTIHIHNTSQNKKRRATIDKKGKNKISIWRLSWRNDNRHRKLTRLLEFKLRTKLLAFPRALISLRKVWT